MTTQEKLVKRKLSIIELAEFLKNASQACRINGVSRQHFYDTKSANCNRHLRFDWFCQTVYGKDSGTIQFYESYIV